MKKLSRRKILEVAAMGAGAAALSACLPKAQPTEPILSPVPLNTPFGSATDTPSPTQPGATESPTFIAQPTASLPDISVAKGGEPEDLVRRGCNSPDKDYGTFVRYLQPIISDGFLRVGERKLLVLSN